MHALSSWKKTWRNLRGIKLRERSPSKKAIYCTIPTIWQSGKGKPMLVKGSVAARRSGIRRKQRTGTAEEIFGAVKLCGAIMQ